MVIENIFSNCTCIACAHMFSVRTNACPLLCVACVCVGEIISPQCLLRACAHKILDIIITLSTGEQRAPLLRCAYNIAHDLLSTPPPLKTSIINL